MVRRVQERSDCEDNGHEKTPRGAKRKGKNTDDLLAMYLRQIGDIPRLSREEEIALAQEIAAHREKFLATVHRIGLVQQDVYEHLRGIGEHNEGYVKLHAYEAGAPGKEEFLGRLRTSLPAIQSLLAAQRDDAIALMKTKFPERLDTFPAAMERRSTMIAGLLTETPLHMDLLHGIADAALENVKTVCATSAQLRDPQCNGFARTLRAQLRESVVLNLNLPHQSHDLLQSALETHHSYVHACQRMVSANLRLVVSVAKRYRYRGLSFFDLIQEGNKGLMHSVRKYDVLLPIKIATYATWWIRQTIMRALPESGRTIRLPQYVVTDLYRLDIETDNLTMQLGHKPTDDEIAKHLQVPIEDLAALLHARPIVRSIDAPIMGPDDGGDDTCADALADRESSIADADLTALREELKRAMECLTPMQKRILELRFGLDPSEPEPQTLEKIGQKLHVSKERIRQIQKMSLAKLHVRSRGRLADYLSE